MLTGLWELVIVWITGDTDVIEYGSRDQAEAIRRGYEMAFGNQLGCACVRPQYVK